MFVDGRFQQPAGRSFEPTFSPATGEHLAYHMQAEAEDVDLAVDAAKRALPAWSQAAPHERARHLYAIARHIQKHARLFAVIESLDNGKTIRETRDADVPLAVRHFYSHAGWAQLMDTEMDGQTGVGVVGQIIPWNFPLLMLAWKVAPALAMGNTVVLKPAPWTRLSAWLFAQVCAEAGLPAGVVNIVSGDNGKGGRRLALLYIAPLETARLHLHLSLYFLVLLLRRTTRSFSRPLHSSPRPLRSSSRPLRSSSRPLRSFSRPLRSSPAPLLTRSSSSPLLARSTPLTRYGLVLRRPP